MAAPANSTAMWLGFITEVGLYILLVKGQLLWENGPKMRTEMSHEIADLLPMGD